VFAPGLALLPVRLGAFALWASQYRTAYDPLRVVQDKAGPNFVYFLRNDRVNGLQRWADQPETFRYGQVGLWKDYGRARRSASHWWLGAVSERRWGFCNPQFEESSDLYRTIWPMLT